MLNVPTVATSSSALNLPPSILAAATPDLGLTRVTPAAVSAPQQDVEVKNEAQGNGGGLVALEAQNDNAPAPGDGVSGGLTGNLTSSGPSATFVAQAFGQTDDAAALAISYAQFLPAPQYDLLVDYGFIKYKPSDAGIPPVPLSFTPLGTQAAAGTDYSAYSVTQSRNAANLSAGLPQPIVA